MILNRLHAFVNGEIELSAPAVTAALGLLKKALPDLSHTEHVGEFEGPIKFIIERIGDSASGDLG